MLATLNKLGGFVITTKDTSGETVGFSYTWPTAEKGTFLLDMIGIREDLRDKGIGYEAIKVLFMEAVKVDAEKILFTYDPLKVRNANIYLRKMGARVVSYEEDPYGGGLSSDRFLAAWNIDNPVEIAERMVDNAGQDRVDTQTLPIVTFEDFPDGEIILLPAPEDNESLPEEALNQWRQFYRSVGLRYFPSYSAASFISERRNGLRENYYLLIRNEPGDSTDIEASI